MEVGRRERPESGTVTVGWKGKTDFDPKALSKGRGSFILDGATLRLEKYLKKYILCIIS